MDVFIQLKTSLAETLDQSFNRAYRDLSAELAARDARIEETEQKAKLANQAQETALSRIEDLECQISFLREELSRQKIEFDDHDAYPTKFCELQEAYDPERVFHAVNHVGLDAPQNILFQAHKDLEGKYRSLYEEFQTLVKNFGTLRTQVKKAKGKVTLWQEYFTRDQFTVPVNGATVTFKRVKGFAAQEQRNQKSSQSLELAASHFTTSFSDTSESGSDFPVQKPGSPPQNMLRSSPQPKPEATDDADRVDLSAIPPADPASTQSEDSDETSYVLSSHCEFFHHATIVAAKSSKRKRQPAQGCPLPTSSCHTLDNGSSPRPISIKSEHTSSSPLRHRDLNPPGTQDLDEVGSTVKTPRKQALRDVKLPVFEDSNFVSNFDDCYPQVQSEQDKSKRPTALRPVDSNRKANLRANGDPRAKRRKVSGRGEQAIPAVAEDGDESYPGSKNGKRSNEPRSPCEVERSPSIGTVLSTHRRLGDLLEVPSPSKSALSPQKTPKTPGVSLKKWLGSSASTRHISPSLKRNSESPNGIARHVTSTRRDQEHRVLKHLDTPNEPQGDSFNDRCTEIRPEGEPYRAWPVHRLDLSCFKINPERNQGMDFAFDEVVRKKDERKCLSVCTRPDCCGDRFRAMVRAGGLASASSDSDSVDLQILEDYLGDQKDMLNTMSDKERQDLLIDAKARLLANQYGKHRYTHERARSPPGFWRADMPDTQELEQDREAARKLEREKVMERYREAMRPGGLWKFADE
ncbi:hypothetical protein VTN00DRAFT_8591 [Thermoascus crustaceus]|uniref:uncharacterized protein n=1 Tax=Thermoascus crustaceus TaxID=5088 RepID=UPI003742ACA7